MRSLIRFPFLATGVSIAALVALAGWVWLPDRAEGKPSSALDRQRLQGNAAYKAGRLQEAANLYSQGFDAATREGDLTLAFKLKTNLGNVLLAEFRYREAIQAYAEARRLAQRWGEQDDLAYIDLSLASLYTLMGDLEAANRFPEIEAADSAAEREITVPSRLDSLKNRDQVFACAALLRAKQGKIDTAIRDFRRAILEADRAGNTDHMATDWDHLGEELLLQRDYPAADQALTEAFRIRTLFHDRNLRVSLIKLAWLRLEQGDVPTAQALLSRAQSMPAIDLGLPPWIVAYMNGRILRKQGKQTEALAVLRQALREAREWQREGALAGIPSAYAEQRLEELYRELVALSVEVDPAVGLEGFVATEEDRAQALSEAWAESRLTREKVPVEYASVLARLRSARATDLAHSTPASQALVTDRQHEFINLQSRLGLLDNSPIGTNYFEKNTAESVLRSIQERIRPEEAVLSLHTGDQASALWVVSRDRIQMCRLPARSVISASVERVRGSRSNAAGAAFALYKQLFGDLEADFQRKPVWIVTADDEFFQIPLSALVSGWKDKSPLYLVEQHAIAHTPSAVVLNSQPVAVPDRFFAGIGDGVYNGADPRWKEIRFRFWTVPSLQLPRLVSSQQELSACSRAWGSTTSLLTGPKAMRQEVEQAIEKHPAVIHLAAHVLAPPDRPNEAALDLGLTPDGQPDVFTKEDIEGIRVPGTTVVMSGCSSGAGGALTTAGVLGLTRAWMIAGARVVIGSRWPVPDDTGELFQAFYRHLAARKADPARFRAAAIALQEAKIEMLHSNSWRSDPRYWSAFYVFGKE